MTFPARWRHALPWEKSKQTLYAVLRKLQLHEALARRPGLHDVVTVLNLHRVSPQADPFWGALHPTHFDELLTFLKRRFSLTLFRELSQRFKRPPLILSFDDGYYDFIEYALPLLKKHRAPANQNVIGACVLSGEPPWNVKMYDALQAAPRALLNSFRPAGFLAPHVDESGKSQQRYGLALSRFLKNRPHQERAPHLEALMAHLQNVDRAPTRMLGLGGIQALGDTIELGCHSFSHESMGYESDAFFLEDVAKCQTFFATTLRKPLQVYAFPNGSHRSSQIDHLLQASIEHVLLVGERYTPLDARVCERITISGQSAAETCLQAVGLRQVLSSRSSAPHRFFDSLASEQP